MSRQIVLLLFLSPLALSLTFGQSTDSSSFAVVGYAQFRFRGGASYDYAELSHLNFSFVHLREGRLSLFGNRDSTALARTVSLKQIYPHLKVAVSVGGWGGCGSCSATFATAEGRRTFVTSARDLLERFGLDGIDLDWEYPAIEGFPGHRYAPEDRHDFTLLLQELRGVLGNRFELTFAAGAFDQYLTSSVEWKEVTPLVDRIYLMTYDLVNGFSTVTGHQTPLYSTSEQVASADHAVRFLDSVGVPGEKIVIGAAFYARVWKDVPDTNHGLHQPGAFAGLVSYKDLTSYWRDHPGFQMLWDSVAAAPYAYNPSERLFATFDDRRSVALKTAYALRHHLGGMMFWELNGDIPEDGLLHTIDSVKSVTRGEGGTR
jgi:chitinase